MPRDACRGSEQRPISAVFLAPSKELRDASCATADDLLRAIRALMKMVVIRHHDGRLTKRSDVEICLNRNLAELGFVETIGRADEVPVLYGLCERSLALWECVKFVPRSANVHLISFTTDVALVPLELIDRASASMVIQPEILLIWQNQMSGFGV